ncbi:MAG: oxidoreductase, partial [Bryobacteraceae bacterium]
RPGGAYGAVVFRAKGVVQSPATVPFSYRPLVEQIVKFFETGTPPVTPEETLEIFAFLDAAQRSKEAGGALTKLR